MAQRWWVLFARVIRDKVKDLIVARKTADGITVGEVVAGIHRDVKRFAASGIYILPPAMVADPLLTDASVDRYRLSVECVLKEYTEAQHLDRLGELVSLIVDALEANPTLDGVAGTQLARVSEVRDPVVPIGLQGNVPFLTIQEVVVTVDVVRT